MRMMILILKQLWNLVCLRLPLMKWCKRLTNDCYLLQNDWRRLFWCKWLRRLTLMTNLCLWKLICVSKTQSKKLKKLKKLTKSYVLFEWRKYHKYRNLYFLRHKTISRRPAFYTFRLNNTMKNNCCIFNWRFSNRSWMMNRSCWKHRIQSI